jgi:hypothetical protein
MDRMNKNCSQKPTEQRKRGRHSFKKKKKLPKRTKLALEHSTNTHMHRMKVSITCRKEMEVREMQKTAVNITLVELGKTHLFLDNNNPTNKRKVRINKSAPILQRE